jgi:hypothetical protein
MTDDEIAAMKGGAPFATLRAMGGSIALGFVPGKFGDRVHLIVRSETPLRIQGGRYAVFGATPAASLLSERQQFAIEHARFTLLDGLDLTRAHPFETSYSAPENGERRLRAILTRGTAAAIAADPLVREAAEEAFVHEAAQCIGACLASVEQMVQGDGSGPRSGSFSSYFSSLITRIETLESECTASAGLARTGIGYVAIHRESDKPIRFDHDQSGTGHLGRWDGIVFPALAGLRMAFRESGIGTRNELFEIDRIFEDHAIAAVRVSPKSVDLLPRRRGDEIRPLDPADHVLLPALAHPATAPRR